MHRPTKWTDRLEVEDGHITRIVNAEYSKKGEYSTVDVYKENDNKEYWDQNLYVSIYGGVVITFPGLRIGGYYYDDNIAEEEGWNKRQRPSLIGYSGRLTKQDEELICGVYPDFKYLLNKVAHSDWNRLYLIRVLQVWVKHPQLELVMAAGYEKVGMDGRFWRYSEKRRREICLFMRKHMNRKYRLLPLKNLNECIKSNDPENYMQYMVDVSEWDRNSRTVSAVKYEDYLYLKKLRVHIESRFKGQKAFNAKMNYWGDYIRMAVRAGHDVHDPYWRHPKDLLAKHDVVMAEIDRIEEAERIAAQQRAAEWEARRLAAEAERAEKFKKELIKLQPKAEKILKKFGQYSDVVDGYSIFVCTDYEEWKRQAEALHQCICAGGYYQKTLKGECTIVFIQKEGVPIATAEVKNDGKIGQFYADERDRSNCLPSPEVKAVFERWYKTVPQTKWKPRKTKKQIKEAA